MSTHALQKSQVWVFIFIYFRKLMHLLCCTFELYSWSMTMGFLTLFMTMLSKNTPVTLFGFGLGHVLILTPLVVPVIWQFWITMSFTGSSFSSFPRLPMLFHPFKYFFVLALVKLFYRDIPHLVRNFKLYRQILSFTWNHVLDRKWHLSHKYWMILVQLRHNHHRLRFWIW